MSNTWFQFKKFKIEQDKCGMKVSTDACVFGSIAVEVLKQFPQYTHGLDIGTGTGLLSLMLVQEHAQLQMDAVEIDKDAFEQAQNNVQHSHWRNRINIVHTSVQDFVVRHDRHYDVIICNPPFFANHLKGADEKRKLARHDTALTHESLLQSVQGLLLQEGLAFLLYPESEEKRVDAAIILTALKVLKKVKIYPSRNKKYNRIVFILGRGVENIQYMDNLYIRDEEGRYTEGYNMFLKNFLLEKNNFLEKKKSIN